MRNEEGGMKPSFHSSFLVPLSHSALGDPAMHRALRRAIGVLTAAGVVLLARPAPGQTPSYPPRTQQTPMRTAFYQESASQSDGHIRLEEMKVELALLSDITTFPYYLGTRATGPAVEVRGYVPNETVKQR